MENRVTQQDVPVGDRTYRLTKTTPRTACWLFAFLADKAEGKALVAALGKCTEEEFTNIQDKALRLVYFLDTREGELFPTPIIGPGGTIVDSYLSEQPSKLFDLTVESVLFNIQPFLAESGSSSQAPKN